MGMGEWKEYKLGEIADITPGFAFKSVDFGQKGEKVVKIKDIIPPIINLTDCEHVDLEKYDKSKLRRFLIKQNDFVVAMTGATIGKIGKLKVDGHAYINQRVAKIDAKEGFCADFVYYALCGDSFQLFVQNNIDSNSAQENISANSLGRFSIFLPSFTEQKRIASVLRSLDDKIDLLHQENKTLEAMAETLFNKTLSEKENNGTIEQLISIQNGYAFKSKDFQERGVNGVIKIKNISGGVIDINKTDCVCNDIIQGISSKFKVHTGDILIAMTGAEIGKLGIIPSTNKDLWLNQRVGMLVERYPGAKYIAYLQLRSDYGLDYVENTATGSAQPNISSSAIENCGFPLLDVSEIKALAYQLEGLYEKIIHNLGHINGLKLLRKELLIKLMNNTNL